MTCMYEAVWLYRRMFYSQSYVIQKKCIYAYVLYMVLEVAIDYDVRYLVKMSEGTLKTEKLNFVFLFMLKLCMRL